MDFLANGLFSQWTFQLMDFSANELSSLWTFQPMDFSAIELFSQWTFQPMKNSKCKYSLRNIRSKISVNFSITPLDWRWGRDTRITQLLKLIFHEINFRFAKFFKIVIKKTNWRFSKTETSTIWITKHLHYKPFSYEKKKKTTTKKKNKKKTNSL